MTTEGPILAKKTNVVLNLLLKRMNLHNHVRMKLELNVALCSDSGQMRFYSKNEQGHCGFLEDWCAHL